VIAVCHRLSRLTPVKFASVKFARKGCADQHAGARGVAFLQRRSVRRALPVRLAARLLVELGPKTAGKSNREAARRRNPIRKANGPA
jgi:hypothetical protein